MQMRRQTRHVRQIRPVTQRPIIFKALLKKVLKAIHRAAFTGLPDILKPSRPVRPGRQQPPIGDVFPGRPARQLKPLRRAKRVRHGFFLQGPPERGIDLERSSRPRLDLPRFEQEGGIEAADIDPVRLEIRLDRAVAFDRMGFVTPVPVDGPCSGFPDQSRQDDPRIAAQAGQAAEVIPQSLETVMKPPAAGPAQRMGVADTVCIFQDEDGKHLPFASGFMERGIVGDAKILAEPDDCGHSDICGLSCTSTFNGIFRAKTDRVRTCIAPLTLSIRIDVFIGLVFEPETSAGKIRSQSRQSINILCPHGILRRPEITLG